MRLRRRGAGGERRQERRRLVPFQGGEFPGAAIGHEGAQELVVERMAGFVGHVAREQRVTGQVQVADGIQDLVPYEFVGESQAFGIEDAVFVEHDGVVEAAALGEAEFAQRLEAATVDLGAAITARDIVALVE